jgi:hypothetical protein
MATLTDNDIEAELSYAYLHAVAAKAGMGCMCTNRHFDNAGVDAMIIAVEKFQSDSVLTDISLHVQLKATSQKPAETEETFSYYMKDIGRYDKLRNSGTIPFRILVVLFLPEDADNWLMHSEDVLAMKRCAYWTSLRGAEASQNKTGVTVYLPKANVFSPDGLRSLMIRLSREEDIMYAG